ncbi:hypothetical protein GCM10028818_28570 [Spirosoma horti]
MYLEERIEQVERQNATTTRAVADLTVDVRAIRRDQTEGFKQVNSRLSRLETDVSGLKQDVIELKQDVSGLKQDVTELKQDVSGLKQDVTELKQDVSELKQDVSELKQDVGTIKQTLQLVLAYLHEKLP